MPSSSSPHCCSRCAGWKCICVRAGSGGRHGWIARSSRPARFGLPRPPPLLPPAHHEPDAFERSGAFAQYPRQRSARRRTFAIISHPDAGKTTLTEHLLLLGGAIHAAGRVKARGEARRAKSDWMKIEQERGISVTSRGDDVRISRTRCSTCWTRRAMRISPKTPIAP